MNSQELRTLEDLLVANDAIVKDSAERLHAALARRSQTMAALEAAGVYRDKDRHLTPVVFILARWSRWKSFNLPACGVGPFTSTEDANAWARDFNEASGRDPDELHAEEWYALHPPSVPLVVHPHGFEFLHAWRTTKRVIWECPCGEQASRTRAEGAPKAGGCPGLHNPKTDTFEAIAQSPAKEV